MCSCVTSSAGQPDSTTPSCFLDLFLYSLFLLTRMEGGGGMVVDRAGRCRLRRSDHKLYSP
jgi:hypothetical protein